VIFGAAAPGPGRLCRVWALLGLLVLGGAFSPLVSTVSGQVEEALAQADLEYEAALRALESAQAARTVVDARFTRALQQADDARQAGDDGRMETALAQAQAQTAELTRLDRRVTQTQEALNQARQAYLTLLDVRLEAILDEAGTAPPVEVAGLQILAEDLNNRLREVEATAGDSDLFRAPVMPEVSFDPRDGPVELRAKAELLQRRAVAYDSLMVRVNGRIGTLERRAERDQSLRQFLEGIDRFGETQLPVRTPDVRTRPPDEGPIAGDSATAGRQLSVEEQIEQLRFLFEELVDTRDQLRVRARLFRNRAGGGVWA